MPAPKLDLEALERRAMASGATPRSAVSQALEAREDDTQESVFRERHAPVLILMVGMAVQVLLYLLVLDGWLKVGALVGAIALETLLLLPLLVGSLILIANTLDFAMGPLHRVVLKAAAITLGPASIADLLFVLAWVLTGYDYQAFAAGLGFYVILCGPLLWLLFEMDLGEVLATLGAIFLVRIMCLLAMGVAFPSLFDNPI